MVESVGVQPSGISSLKSSTRVDWDHAGAVVADATTRVISRE
jgi:hypothetical protein